MKSDALAENRSHHHKTSDKCQVDSSVDNKNVESWKESIFTACLLHLKTCRMRQKNCKYVEFVRLVEKVRHNLKLILHSCANREFEKFGSSTLKEIEIEATSTVLRPDLIGLRGKNGGVARVCRGPTGAPDPLPQDLIKQILKKSNKARFVNPQAPIFTSWLQSRLKKDLFVYVALSPTVSIVRRP
jgi:hypothetical protein